MSSACANHLITSMYHPTLNSKVSEHKLEVTYSFHILDLFPISKYVFGRGQLVGRSTVQNTHPYPRTIAFSKSSTGTLIISQLLLSCHCISLRSLLVFQFHCITHFHIPSLVILHLLDLSGIRSPRNADSEIRLCFSWIPRTSSTQKCLHFYMTYFYFRDVAK